MNAELDGPQAARRRSIYAFAITFVAAVGGFLFGYDLALIAAANMFLKEQFHLSEQALGLFNNWTGWSVMGGYIPMLFEMSGVESRQLAILQFSVTYLFMAIVTLISLWLVDRLGRRPLWIFASIFMAIITALTGAVFHFDTRGGDCASGHHALHAATRAGSGSAPVVDDVGDIPNQGSCQGCGCYHHISLAGDLHGRAIIPDGNWLV
ncbi:MAG: MFS transporter [Armatimonadetes bacterium]|nr:MFS transporter [Armatimonadota bacterium]